MAHRYHDALEDPELMALRDDIAVLNARQAEVLATTSAGTNAWDDMKAAADDYRAAARDHDLESARVAMKRILEIVDERMQDADAWAQFERLATRKAALIAQERKRLIDGQQMMTVREGMAFANALLSSVLKHVDEPRKLAAIRTEFARIVGSDVQGILDTVDTLPHPL